MVPTRGGGSCSNVTDPGLEIKNKNSEGQGSLQVPEARGGT